MKYIGLQNDNQDVVNLQKILAYYGTFEEMLNQVRPWFTHFDNPSDFTIFTSGTSALLSQISYTSVPDAYFVIALETGTSSTGRCGFTRRVNITSSTGKPIAIGHGEIKSGILIDSLPVLSTSSDEFAFCFGLMDVENAKNGTGIYLCYDRLATNGTNWLLRTKSASGAVVDINTGIVVATGTKYFVELIVNAAGTEIKLYINDALVATQNTAANFPGNTTPLNLNAFIIKSAGTTNRTIWIDAAYQHWIPDFLIYS